MTVVLHDLNLAARYADRIAVLQGGKRVACGAPGDVLTPALLAAVFHIDAQLLHPPGVDWPLIWSRSAISPTAAPMPAAT